MVDSTPGDSTQKQLINQLSFCLPGDVSYCPKNFHFLWYLMLCFRCIYFHNHDHRTALFCCHHNIQWVIGPVCLKSRPMFMHDNGLTFITNFMINCYRCVADAMAGICSHSNWSVGRLFLKISRRSTDSSYCDYGICTGPYATNRPSRASVSCRRPTHSSAWYRSASAGILPLIIFLTDLLPFYALCNPWKCLCNPWQKS